MKKKEGRPFMKKAILFLLCLAMLVSAVACKGDSGESEDTGNTGAQKKTYTSILETYVRYLSQKAALQPLSQAEDEIDGAVRAAVESCEDTAAMGYATKDLNGDSIFDGRDAVHLLRHVLFPELYPLPN